MANDNEEGVKLSHLFSEIWATHEKLENSTETSSSDAVQVPLSCVIPLGPVDNHFGTDR